MSKGASRLENIQDIFCGNAGQREKHERDERQFHILLLVLFARHLDVDLQSPSWAWRWKSHFFFDQALLTLHPPRIAVSMLCL